jgi:hypothetical protein
VSIQSFKVHTTQDRTSQEGRLPDLLYSLVLFCGSRDLNGCAVTLSRARTCLCSFNFTIAWRRIRYQRVEQLCRSLRYQIDRAVENLLVCLRRLCKSAQLPHELQRRGANLCLRRRRFEVMKCFDISTHAVLLPPCLKSLRQSAFSVQPLCSLRLCGELWL